MKRTSKIKAWSPKELKTLRKPDHGHPSADAFWYAFRERAAKTPQQSPLSCVRRPWLAPAVSMAVVAFVVGFWFWMVTGSYSRDDFQVEVLDTGASVSSYMIWDDTAGRGTLLWLMDADHAEEGGS